MLYNREVSPIPVAKMPSFGIGELLGIKEVKPESKLETKPATLPTTKAAELPAAPVTTTDLLNRVYPTVGEIGLSTGTGSATN